MQSSENSCRECGKTFLIGRADRRFCNDSCRNAFNRKKKVADQVQAYDNLPDIFKAIKKNYEILKNLGGKMEEDGDTKFIPRDQLLSSGINLKFCTSIYQDKFGQLWHCLFERGYHYDDTYAYIADFPDQVKL
jgi:hypothetical protein